jgi:catechol 2,3-dioxygenase-like lactoylglutathione lyase family enzyme
MPDTNFIILYVDSPAASAAFYVDLLGHAPVEASPTFALFAQQSGVKLGLWSRRAVEPAATTPGGGTELAFAVDSDATVTSMHIEWARRGLPILQAPVRMDFGYTFVASDPDGHRLRVFAPRAR